MKFEDIQKLEDKYQLPTYQKYPFALVRGRDCRVWDSEGNEYLDLYGGHAVCLVGHSHPDWTKAMTAQMDALAFYSNVCYSDVRAEAAQLLVEAAPDNLSSAFFCNSGTEADETAIKLARKFTGRKTILSMRNGFHGRTLGTLSACGFDNYRDPAYDLNPHHAFCEFGNLDSVAAAMNGDVAAVILEPIQSMGGMATATPEYMRGLRALCDKHGALLIFDEIQTYARTGNHFAAQTLQVKVDLLTLAKGVAGSYTAGAVLVDGRIAATVKHGDQGTTFGGSPMACAGIRATLQILEREQLISRALSIYDTLRSGLERVPQARGLLGLGLLVGIEFDRPAKDVVRHLLGKRILASTASSNPNVLRLMPPLTVTQEDIGLFIDALGDLA